MEEENPEGYNPEEIDDPNLGNEPERLEEVSECPLCRYEVQADATGCPSCGAVFQGEEQETPLETGEEQMPSSMDKEDELIPSEIEEMPEWAPKSKEPVPKKEAPSTAISDERGLPPEKVSRAIEDYSKRRRSRYLYGALSLGIAIILFVLLWLVVVYDVLVTETENVFGIDVIILLVVAGILFILGLYLILTYPKSSLSELLASLPMQVSARETKEE
ncbi:MAG: hypothetical protein JSW00_11405 [Thermoplasmata archaeon]|nr:MAG: hypothetical protein JSW00_11405 [Thermoplasmata archaeon]